MSFEFADLLHEHYSPGAASAAGALTVRGGGPSDTRDPTLDVRSFRDVMRLYVASSAASGEAPEDDDDALAGVLGLSLRRDADADGEDDDGDDGDGDDGDDGDGDDGAPYDGEILLGDVLELSEAPAAAPENRRAKVAFADFIEVEEPDGAVSMADDVDVTADDSGGVFVLGDELWAADDLQEVD